MNIMRKKKKIMWSVVRYTLILLFGLFFAFPFLWALSTSFKGAEDILSWPPVLFPRQPTLDNYRYVFNEIPMLRYFLNSIIITGLGVFLQLVFSALAAYPLAKFEFKGRDLIFYLILAPMLIPVQGALVVNFITIMRLQLVDTFLGVVIPSAVSIFGIFLLRQHYQSVPRELEDAARIDGCSEFRLWWNIELPLVKPALGTLAIFSFVAYWNSFLWPLIVLRDTNKYPLQVAIAHLSTGLELNYRYITASLMVAALPILLFFIFTQRYFIEGFEGALKE